MSCKGRKHCMDKEDTASRHNLTWNPTQGVSGNLCWHYKMWWCHMHCRVHTSYVHDQDCGDVVWHNIDEPLPETPQIPSILDFKWIAGHCKLRSTFYFNGSFHNPMQSLDPLVNTLKKLWSMWPARMPAHRLQVKLVRRGAASSLHTQKPPMWLVQFG